MVWVFAFFVSLERMRLLPLGAAFSQLFTFFLASLGLQVSGFYPGAVLSNMWQNSKEWKYRLLCWLMSHQQHFLGGRRWAGAQSQTELVWEPNSYATSHCDVGWVLTSFSHFCLCCKSSWTKWKIWAVLHAPCLVDAQKLVGILSSSQPPNPAPIFFPYLKYSMVCRKNMVISGQTCVLLPALCRWDLLPISICPSTQPANMTEFLLRESLGT